MKRASIHLLACAALAALVPALAAAERTEHQEWTVKPGGTLHLKTFAGSVSVKTHDAETIVFDSVLQPSRRGDADPSLLADIEFAYDVTDDVHILVRWKDGRAPRRAGLTARHTVVVPARYHIAVETAGGEIAGDGIGGNVVAQTAGGNLRFGRIDGDVRAQTAGGQITVDQAKGDVAVKTSGGGIQVSGARGRLSAQTSGGNIRVDLAVATEKPIELATSGGNIEVAVPSDFKADLNARTAGGSVKCDLPIDGDAKRGSVQGKINGGGPAVNLKTSGGNIHVTRK